MSGQVPVWIPLVVALLGVVGVLAGQWINARREEKLEDLRWKRQRIANEINLRLEHSNQWRETKLRVYGEFVGAIRTHSNCTHEVIEILERLQTLPPSTETEWEIVTENLSVIGDKMANTEKTVRKVHGEIILISSKDMIAAITALTGAEVSRGSLSSLGEASPDSLNRIIIQWKSYGKMMDAALRKLITAARSELGIDVPAFDEAS